MKFSSTLITLVVVFLFVCGQQVHASSLNADSLKDDNQQKQTIILVDVVQPFLFGKVGIGIGWQTIEREFLFYGNYVF